MKKIVLLLSVAAGICSHAEAQKIKGSDTMLPLSQRAAEVFMKADPSRTVTVTGGGSGVGIAALIEGTTDLAQSSRGIKFDEKKRLKEKGEVLHEVTVARDALAVIVHPLNPVSELTREQLEGIFTGKITNWKEVGGDDRKIIPYARETSSGTHEFFKESILRNKSYVNGIMSMPATGAIMQSVAQTRGAIGYVGLAYLNEEVKALRVSYDGGKKYIAPSVAAARSGAYPVVRPLYYYYVERSAAKARPFIDYLLSPDGQKLVSEVGFVTVE
ncbi:MAG: PstS family phosphate ABC transporter substrate-binding protein [Odoribacteraceae bacterium]|jgi:phosphate transport system substrate-binding protein|nr:PstS family phosphate ABC transporter substrate-binding protein [Odoribacteraceae bacterium]